MATDASLVADRDLDLVNKLRQLFGIARNARRTQYEVWRRNYRLVNNRIGAGVTQGGGVAPRDSEIYPTLASIAAWMTDQNTNIDVTAAADPNNDYYTFMSAIAEDLATVMQTNWTVECEKREIKMAVWDSFQYGAGFFKAVWDQSLAGGLGNAKFLRVDPWSLYFDPTATSLADCEYIVEVRRMSLDEIERRWPGSSAALEMSLSTMAGEGIDDRPNQNEDVSRIPKANPGSFTPGVTPRWGGVRSSGDGSATLPSVVVYEFWIKENDVWWDSELEDDNTGLTLAPGEKPAKKDEDDTNDTDDKHVSVRWRVCVLAANHILMDEWSDELYSFGEHPYERYVFEETGEMYGIALVDHLAQPQLALNRLLTSVQQNAELVGNPIFIEAANSGLDRVNIINKPGQRLRLQGTGAMANNRPDWLRPPEMPTFVQTLIEFWIQRIENISGLSAAIKGGVQSSRTPEGVMATIQEASFVRIRGALANLEQTLSQIGYKLADLIIDNYTEPRVVAVVGSEGENSALALSSRHFIVPTHKGASPLKYALVIQAGATMPTSRQARMTEADQAYALGIIDRQAWMEAHSYPHWQKVLNRVNQAIADGSFQPPGARQRAQH